MSKFVVIVPCRAGSKGLLRKNILPFCGRELYKWAVQQGQRFSDLVIVSTDIEEILACDHGRGVLVHNRDSSISEDFSPMDKVILDVIDKYNLIDVNIVLLQPTSPLRLHEDIIQCIDLFTEGDYDLVLTASNTDSSCLKFGMIEGSQFSPLSDSSYPFMNRQSLPLVYRPNGAVYVFNSRWFKANGGFSTEKIGVHVMPRERSLDIDTKKDFLDCELAFRGE